MSKFAVIDGKAVLSGGSLTLTSTSASAITRALRVGVASSNFTASLAVQDGAVFNTFATGLGGALISGSSSSASATVTVNGPSSRWDAARIDIGLDAGNAGAVVAENGGVINATDVTVGRPAGGTLLIQTGGIVNSHTLNVGSGAADAAHALSIRTGGRSTANETILATTTTSVDIDRGTLTTAMLTSTPGNGSITLRDPAGGSALVISGTGASATYAGSISGSGGITKNGPSAQTLAGQNTYSGPTTVNGGTLVLGSGSSASYTANGPGHINLEFGDLGHSALRVAGGGTIQYPPVVFGGFIRGAQGTHDLKAVTSFNGTTFAGDSALTHDKPLTLYNVTNNGDFTSNESLTWDGGANSTSGIFNINSKTNVTSFLNDGVINVGRGGQLVNSNTRFVSGGGSRIVIDREGRLELPSSELHLRGGLLVNKGVIKGIVNVHFNGLAAGSGEFGEVRLFDNGRFAPGETANPASFSPAAVAVAGAASFATGSVLEVEIGGQGAGEFDQVNVAGHAALAGTLAITTTNDFVPAALDAFTVISFDAREGAFSTYLGTDVGNGLAYAPIYGKNDLSLIATIPGDASLDGRVDFTDLVAVAQNYNTEVSAVTDSWWLRGDFTYDGLVDFNDLVVLAQHYGQSSAIPANAFSPEFQGAWASALGAGGVPEPSLAGLLLLPFMLRRGRRK
jgi:autotransporter-associated beta strand protein